MMAWVYVNGQVVPEKEARVSVYDHGFLYGDGIFDTMRSYQGQVFALDQHFERLEANARELRLPLSLSRSQISEAISEVLTANDLQEAYIRLSLTRGEGAIGIDYRLCQDSTVVIMARALTANSSGKQGIKLVPVRTRRTSSDSLNPTLKSMNFLNNIIAKMELIDAGHPEGVLLNAQGWLTEATTSNLFFWDGSKLCTPAVAAGLLPGVTRGIVMKLATELGIAVQEGFYRMPDLYRAEEAFLTNSISEIIPVTCVADKSIGTGHPGEITQRLQAAYREAVNKWLRKRL